MIAFAFGPLRKGVCGFLGRLPELRPGLLLLLALTPLITPGREVTREQIGPGVQVLRGAVNGAWLVKRDGGETFFFIGDSFTPAGIDDYCLLNRNFLHEGMGYFRCLETVKREAPEAWLINQHVAPAFQFSTGQLEEMLGALRRRVALLQALLPWDDPNFGLDEGWARFHPYAVEVRPGQPVRFSLRIWNHSSAEQTFLVRPRLPQGWASGLLQPLSLRVPARAEGAVDVAFVAPANASAGLHLVTADVSWGDWELREWTEAMVTVAQRPTAENP